MVLIMATLKQRIENLEQEAFASFDGYALVCSWEYGGETSQDGLAAYIAANGPIPPGKQVVLMGWAKAA